MEWVWNLYRGFVRQELARAGRDAPSAAEREAMFARLVSESTITVLVQEPWQNSVRFKRLARYPAADVLDLLNDPPGFLLERFGGGKFKLNFHHGWHFVATHNFKPDGPPRWRDLPELEADTPDG